MYLGADIFRPWSRVLRLIRGLWGNPRRFRISRWSFAEVVPFLRMDEDSPLESHFFCEDWCCREFPRREPNERRFTMSLSSCFSVVPLLTTFDASVTLLSQGKEQSATLTINNLHKQVIVRCQIYGVKYGMRTCDVVFWMWTKHDSSDRRIYIGMTGLLCWRMKLSIKSCSWPPRATNGFTPNQSLASSFVEELKEKHNTSGTLSGYYVSWATRLITAGLAFQSSCTFWHHCIVCGVGDKAFVDWLRLLNFTAVELIACGQNRSVSDRAVSNKISTRNTEENVCQRDWPNAICDVERFKLKLTNSRSFQTNLLWKKCFKTIFFTLWSVPRPPQSQRTEINRFAKIARFA